MNPELPEPVPAPVPPVVSEEWLNDYDIHAYNEEALRDAVMNGHLEMVRYLVSKGADIHAEDNEALGWAAEYGHLEVVSYLVSQGGDIHAYDDQALRWAAENGHLEVVQYLVSQGGDIHADNDDALRWAAGNGHLEVVSYLVSRGANYKCIFHTLDKEIQICIVRYILSIKKIQRWILAIFSKPYYKDGSDGFLARQGWEEIRNLKN